MHEGRNELFEVGENIGGKAWILPGFLCSPLEDQCTNTAFYNYMPGFSCISDHFLWKKNEYLKPTLLSLK